MSTLNKVTSKNTEGTKIAMLAVSLLLAAQTTIQSVQAQGLEAGSFGSLSQTSSLGPEQESLLPPEVVPLDPVVAQKMSQSQAQSRAASMDAMPQAQGFAPGMNNQLGQMQTAQDFRKAAFNSLMGQTNAQPRQPFAQGMQGQNGFMTNQPLDGSQLGQSPLVSNNGNPQLNQSGWMQPGQNAGMVNNGISTNPQSQTLSGGVKHKQYRRSIKRAGFSNALSAMAGFGSGMMLGGMVRNPNTALGLGMMGLGMTGFGTRNAFRF